ncbi:MAG: n-acetylglutamate synthase [Chitinophagaceae bacterium]|nr:MAG: n-acetylglutamate synthase [Chitinophagaceae bacterium]
MINYNDKIFRAVSNSPNGETSTDTVFHYKQDYNIVTAEYAGGKILKGQLIGLVDEEGKLEFCYQQVNDKEEIMTGICVSTPELLSNGKIKLHEKWRWTNGDLSEGVSVVEEV